MAEKPEKSASIHAGHRERIRERFRNEGLGSFSEHEVLELLLTYAIPQRDVNPLAHELISCFGGLSRVLEADESDLMQVKGVGRNAALLLTMMPQLMRYYQINTLGKRPIIINLADAKAFCAPLFMGVNAEHIYMVCLDQAGHVLHLSLLYTGTVDRVALYPRTVVENAIRHNAHSVILAHNHPGGAPEPSRADVETNSDIASALYYIGVTLVDHLIFGGAQVYSMSRRRLIGDSLQEAELSYVVRSGADVGQGLKEEQLEWIGFAPQSCDDEKESYK